jgi:hypothetical protein
MSMYLPNPAVGPAESEPAEFIDLPPMADYSGNGEVVRSVIHDLHDEITVIDQRRAR